MARKVFISSAISVDEDLLAVAEQDPLAQLLWPWLLTSLDDWGRGSANAKRLKAEVWPNNDLVTVEAIDRALALYAEVGLIILYTVDGKRYLAVREASWWAHQTHIHKDKRASGGSRIPEPPPAAESRGIPRDAAEFRDAPRSAAESRASLPPSPPPSPPPSLPPSPSPQATGNDPPSHEDPPQGSPSCSPPRGGQRATPPQAGEYPPEFEAAWRVYPRHDEKRAAYAAWHARVREGVSPAVLAAAARHYAAHVADRNPRYVKLGKTFWGPHRPYEDYVTDRGPPGAAEPSAWAALRAALEGGDDR